jgi:hypothetical protein
VKERKKSYVEPLVVLIPRYRQLISRSAAEYQDLPQEDKFKKEFKIAVLLAHETAHAFVDTARGRGGPEPKGFPTDLMAEVGKS